MSLDLLREFTAYKAKEVQLQNVLPQNTFIYWSLFFRFRNRRALDWTRTEFGAFSSHYYLKKKK